MSAGTSNSSGTDNTNTKSTGTMTGTQTGNTSSNTVFNNTGVAQTKVPGYANAANKTLLTQNMGANSNAVDFLSGLLSNPLDTSAPKNRYSTALDNLFKTELTRARSGDSQSVGNAKQGQREASAITDAQTAAIGTGTTAAQSLLSGANPEDQLNFARLIAPQVTSNAGTANTTGTSKTNTQQATTGTQNTNENMSGSNSGFGITLCCWIFMEHYRAVPMPWYVRRCRDQFCSGSRVAGYRRMASWLVPLMQKSALVSSINLWLMIKPMERFGAWLYGESRWGWLAAPVTAFWFGLWNVTGKEEK